MKKSILAVVLAVTFALVSGTVEARERNNARRTSDVTTTSAAAPEHSGSGGGASFGIGVSSIDPIPSATGGFTNVGSLTSIIAFTGTDLVQLLAAIQGTSGSFRFGAGALYKHTLVGNNSSGFHLGGGVGLGTNGEFAANFSGVIGVHTTIGSGLAVHFDGGPNLALFKTAAVGGTDTTVNFSLTQFSPILGASVVYMF